jgi:hypothetical protein
MMATRNSMIQWPPVQVGINSAATPAPPSIRWLSGHLFARAYWAGNPRSGFGFAPAVASVGSMEGQADTTAGFARMVDERGVELRRQRRVRLAAKVVNAENLAGSPQPTLAKKSLT